MIDERWGRKVGFPAFRAALLAVGMLFLVAMAPGLAVEISDIPKPQRRVTDLTGSIPPSSIAEIQATADRIERETGGQLVVVVLGTLGGKESRPFATELFNAWGIGRAARDDGVLLFVALDDHRLELLLGSGIDDPERQRASDEIVQQVMVPRLKAGDPGGALVQGAAECARRIYGLGAPAEGQADGPPPLPVASRAPALPNPGQAAVERDGLWRFGLVGWLVALAGVFGPIVIWRIFEWRLRLPRKCPTCRQAMLLLDESQEDAHLTAGEKTEEDLKSADYDVWACPACDKVLKLRHGTFFTRYRRCPKCNFVTGSTSTRTVTQATSLIMGQIQVDETCANCSYFKSTTHWTPMIADTSNVSYSSFADSGSVTDFSSAVDSSSSSSDSGSSGGGSTDGGGSSGSW